MSVRIRRTRNTEIDANRGLLIYALWCGMGENVVIRQQTGKDKIDRCENHPGDSDTYFLFLPSVAQPRTKLREQALNGMENRHVVHSESEGR